MNQTTQQTGKQGDTASMETPGMSPQGTSGSGAASRQPRDLANGRAEEHSEGIVAKTIEQQTAKLPSDLFLWSAVGGMAVSAVMELTGHKDKSRFFGQWVAPLLLFGVYNKLVKVHGSDQTEKGY